LLSHRWASAVAGVLVVAAACRTSPTSSTALPVPPQAGSPVVDMATPSPPSAPTPVVLPSPSLAPVTKPGEAQLVGYVIDASSMQPIAGALVELSPYQRQARTDPSGRVEFLGLTVAGRCRWLTVVVSAPGHGTLQVIDNPLYPLRATFDFRLGVSDQRSYIGPPSSASEGEAYCSR
jgi:hypothetical protein